MTAVEQTFSLRSGLRLAARRHRQGASTRVLAVHGWLDNAASFDALAACLPDCDILAVDLPGHGRSDHRPTGTWYHYVDYLHELLELLDQQSWPRSVWLGHSLGGALLALLAATHPERVERLILIESAGPLAGAAARASEQLRRGLDDRARYLAGPALRVFADPAEAVAARRKVNGLSEAAAAALVDRGLRAVPGGYQWASDPRLTLASPFRVDETHIRQVLQTIACPTLVLAAEPPMPVLSESDRVARLACLADARMHSFPGHHHLHMETPAPLAAAITEFLSAPHTSPL